MSFCVKNDLLKELETEVRKIHSKLIIGIAHNVLKNPKLIPEMKQKYLKLHSNTNIKDTIRTPRIYMDEHEEENIQLKELLQELDLDPNLDIDSKDRCIYMVRVNREIRQCKHIKGFDTDFCSYHEDEIIYPFGLKEIVEIKNDFLSDDEDDY
jgi:hypothetical protein